MNQFIETFDPTIEDSYRTIVLVDGQSCLLEILDTAGQEEYTGLRNEWIRTSEGAVVVYSISSRESWNRIKIFHSQISRVKDDAQFPVLIVGNKSDRATERQVSTQEGYSLAASLGCKFIESSAKSCKNIEEPFHEIVRQMQKRRLNPQPQRPGGGEPMALDNIENVESGSPRSGQRPFMSILRMLKRQEIYIPASEGASEAGRHRLTLRLIEAARAGREKEVRVLLSSGAYKDGQPGVDGAAIHAASSSGHVSTVNLLLRNGAAINAKGPSGVSPLQIAAAEGHSSIVRLLLHKGAHIEQSSTLHGTALCAAVSRARLKVVRILLAKGANPNAPGGPYGNPLQAGAWVGNVAVVDALHNNGAVINARGEGDCTALQVASFAGNAGVVQSLLVRGALIDIPGGKYGCALEAANASGHFDVVRILLESGAAFETVVLPTLESFPAQTNDSTTPNPPDDWPLTPEIVSSLSSSPPSNPHRQPKVNPPSPRLEITNTTTQPDISDLGLSTIADPSDANIEYNDPF